MKPPHPKYRIKQNDTITALTEMFGVSEEIWKRYHNNMCRLDDVILDTLPEHLEEIYLIPELWGNADILNRKLLESKTWEKQVKRKLSSLGWENTLPLWKKPQKIKYGIKKIIEVGAETSTIRYELELNSFNLNAENLVEVNKVSNVYINDMLPDLIADNLAVDVSDFIYPITFKLNKIGQIESISNFDEIKCRWEKGKEKMRAYRVGESLEKYFRLMDKSFAQHNLFLKRLKTDWFYHTFFLGIYKTYTDKFYIDEIIDFPLTQSIDGIKYKTRQEINKYLDNYDLIQVKITGEIIDERSVMDIKYKLNMPSFLDQPSINGTYYAKYFIDSHSKIIDSLITKCSVNLDKYRKITIKISSIT